MRMRAAALILMVLIFFVFAAAGQTHETPRIIVGSKLDYYPYSYLDDKGRPAGFFIELTQAIAEVMNLDIEIRIGPWHKIKEALKTGEIDVIAGMSYLEERDKSLDFSPAYATVSHAVFARKNSPKIKSEAELCGKRLIAVRGNIMHDYALEKGLSKDLMLADTQAEALNLLASGKGDYALAPKLSGLYWIKKLGLKNITTVGPLLQTANYCYAVKEGNFGVLGKFCEGIAILKELRQFQRVYNKWFMLLEPRGILLGVILKYAAFILIPLVIFLILIGSILWSRALKIQVIQKTTQLKEEINERKKTEGMLRTIKEELEIRFAERTRELDDKFRKLDRSRRAMLYMVEDLNLQGKRIAAAKEYSDNIIKSMIDTLIVFDPAGKIKTVNYATVGLLGYSEDELIGKDIGFILPREKEGAGEEKKEEGILFRDARLKNLAEEGFIRDYYMAYKTKSGERIPVTFSGSVIKNTAGAITAVVGIARDMREIKRLMQKEQELAVVTTEMEMRKQAGEVLRRSEERLRKTQEIAHLGSWEFDLVNNQLVWSPEVYLIYGLKPQEFGATFEAFLERVHPDDRAAVNEAYFGSIRDGKNTYEIEHRVVRRETGEIRVVHERCEHIRDGLGKVVRSVGMVHDITERKMAEDALHRSEAWLSATLKSAAGDAMIVTSASGYILFMNPIAEMLTGWKEPDAQGLPLKAVFNIIDEESGREAVDPVAKVIREGNITGLGNHAILIARDGTRRPVDDSAAPIKDSEGNFIGVVLIFRDITERRKAEKKIQEAIQAKSAFTSMVSHELRTPLGALKESVSLLSEGMLGEINEEQKKFLGIAKSNVDRLARLINQVLDFQTLESGKVAFKMEDGDINEAVKEVREAMLPLAERKNLDFTLDLDENLPKVRFNRDKIIQVLTNLVNNSLKVTEKGGITVTTTLGNNIVRVSVKDTGPGIREEDMPRLFQQYEQLERKSGGTGLGLAISMEIIKAHGGKIWAESKLGEGTTFHFILSIKERREG